MSSSPPEPTPATISVVIPSFNRRARLTGAVRSALAQRPAPLEVIVVDDASSDGTDAAELTALDPRVRVLRHPLRRGGGAARNSGIDAAAGQWVALLDADDTWLPGKLAAQLAAVAALGGSNVYSCGNVCFEDGPRHGQLYNHRPPERDEDLGSYFLLAGCTFQTSTLLLPAALARAIRFDERLRIHQDWDFILRLRDRGACFAYCHQALAAYWDAEDPARVSRGHSAQQSLSWLLAARPRLAADAAAAYYLRSIFPRYLAESPLAALAIGLRLGLGHPAATRWVMRRSLARLRELLSRASDPR